MTLTQRRPELDVMVEQDVVMHSAARKGLAALRIGFGLTFLWAFVDKMFALGFHTGVNDQTGAVDRFGPDAWINGGSPTFGFLKFGVSPDNPFHGFYTGIAGAAWADWLFMAGLLGIGLALTLGFGIRIAAGSAVALYLMMWTASMPLQTNPVIDDHILGLLTVIVLALTLAGDTWGIGKTWAKTNIVRRFPALR
jgi:thiosulfate dehydrogenase (quinone) large subunit